MDFSLKELFLILRYIVPVCSSDHQLWWVSALFSATGSSVEIHTIHSMIYYGSLESRLFALMDKMNLKFIFRFFFLFNKILALIPRQVLC